MFVFRNLIITNDNSDQNIELTTIIQPTLSSKKSFIVRPFSSDKLSSAYVVPLMPLIKIKYVMAVKAIPLKMAPYHLFLSSKLNVIKNLVIH